MGRASQAGHTELQGKLDGARAQLKAAQHAGQQLLAQAEVRSQLVDELKSEQADWRAKGEAEGAAALELRATYEAVEREATRLRETLSATEDKLRLTQKVSERVRAEAADEHTNMLEMQAKLETLQEHYDVLVRSTGRALDRADQGSALGSLIAGA